MRTVRVDAEIDLRDIDTDDMLEELKERGKTRSETSLVAEKIAISLRNAQAPSAFIQLIDHWASGKMSLTQINDLSRIIDKELSIVSV